MIRENGNWNLSDYEMQTVIKSFLLTAATAVHTGIRETTNDALSITTLLELVISKDGEIDVGFVDFFNEIYEELEDARKESN